MRYKTVLICFLLSITFLFSGCYNFYAKSDISDTINTNGFAAINTIKKECPKTDEEIKNDCESVKTSLKLYYELSTTNIFEYMFQIKGKKIYLSKQMYNSLTSMYAAICVACDNFDNYSNKGKRTVWTYGQDSLIIMMKWNVSQKVDISAINNTIPINIDDNDENEEKEEEDEN